MKDALNAIVIIALASAGTWLAGWWWILVLAAFVGGFLLSSRWWTALLTGVLSGAVLWGGLALVASMRNDHILLARLTDLLPVHPILLTTVLGAVAAGLGALSGYSLRDIVRS